ncbi:calcium-transporting ATPase 12, plasma membrane-type-like [Humulus lupulus]|uniref:calcium-transporting ATPase 12, plasma membrane-type-like n=1 Tax=Humulus lupulus TaxID=3486 RepID=UPI002B4057F8|nr:calcium-transporting ATPase 12, plasma membrane-type-like [Humulus lupulus]
MKVTDFLLGNDFMVQDMYSSIALEVKRLLQEGIALNILSISPIEKAINSWALGDLEMDREYIKTNFNIHQIEAFTTEKNENWILAKRKADNKTIQVHLNGAAQLILQVCSWYYDASGSVNKIDHDLKLKLEQNIQRMAANKLKCIAFAHKEVQDDAKANVLKDDMILLGIVGIEDRCRPELKNVVKDLHNAGVKLIMITGDNICGAKAIAEECGILEHHSGEVVKAAEFRNFTLEERKEKVNKICVMENSSPEDKRLMVECLNV